MPRKRPRPILPWLLPVALAFSSCVCSEKAPVELRVIPAEADVLVVADVRALLSYLRDAATRLVPERAKQNAQAFELFLSQVKSYAGVDPQELKRVSLYLTFDPMLSVQLGFFLEGAQVGAAPAPGQDPAIASFGPLHVANLGPEGSLASFEAATTAHMLACYLGQQKNLTQGSRAKLFEQLKEHTPELSQFRAYLLDDQPRNIGFPLQYSFRGGALFAHLDKGALQLLAGDEKAAADARRTIEGILSPVRMSLAFGGTGLLESTADTMGFTGLDPTLLKLAGEVLNKLFVRTDALGLVFSYQGNLRPIADKVIAPEANRLEQLLEGILPSRSL